MPAQLLRVIESSTFDEQEISGKTAEIHAAVLRESEYIDAPNFEAFHPADLELAFHEYDRLFFDGQIAATLGETRLEFSLSRRLTSSAGKTKRLVDRTNGERHYEISASTSILFGCFDGENHRPIIASGIECRDRLDALQRVMEHELVHLIEYLLWETSSCSQARFHSITRRFFGHTENRHQLITPRERAMVKFGIRPGMRVRFRFDGVEHEGLVNRVTKRATVLVEDERGQRYSDGRHYKKFYVPVQQLAAVE